MQFIEANGSIVASAELLAKEIVIQLTDHKVVMVDLSQMRGLSSSYFNVLLQRVGDAITLAEFPQRVRLQFDTAAQEQVFNRSLEYARRTVA
ncbi:MAG: hypothetical protein IT447_07715 [Phycisphaerales bacterium]|nr:hypothetical protein [Phycisphaerales bacterium]